MPLPYQVPRQVQNLECLVFSQRLRYFYTASMFYFIPMQTQALKSAATEVEELGDLFSANIGDHILGETELLDHVGLIAVHEAVDEETDLRVSNAGIVKLNDA